MKQLGMGFIQYIQDCDERYPGAGQYQTWGNGGHWVGGGNDTDGGDNGKLASLDNGAPTGKRANISGGALYTYIKSEQIYICPSNPDGQRKGLTYSMNCALGGASDVAVQESTLTALLLDEDKANDGFVYAANSDTSTDTITSIHNGGGNVLFVDGHVKFYPFGAFPVRTTVGDAAAKTVKTKTVGGPRFWLGPGYTGDESSGFGSCNAPSS
jgi:prepilin-type processing-associated H-X9-DG protein